MNHHSLVHIAKKTSSLVIVTFVSVLSLWLIYIPSLHAQDAQNSPFDIQMYFSDQNPQTKEFKLKIVISSKINSDRNTMKLILPDGISTKSGEAEITGYYCKIKQGENTECIRDTNRKADDNFEFITELIPRKPIADNIIFSIQAYIDGAEKSYTVTQIATLNTNNKYELIPISPQYTQLANLINIRQISNQITLVVFVIFLSMIILRRVYLYVNPQIKSELPHNSKILDAYNALETQKPPSARKQK